MDLSGKISIEVGIEVPAAKFFDVLAKQFHKVQNICGRIQGAKLHEGDDWHCTHSVKQWTSVVDGKVITYKERIEVLDEENKLITYKIFDDDVNEHYKDLKITLQVTEKDDEHSCIKWTFEYEKIDDDVEVPYGFVELCYKSSKDIVAHLLKA
ncbi:MLP-like protein 31 [Arachis stenosperma]|uniref:MLP-like protein 31 n=1 Tax=Arachis stenosperma TaxID=217475 RepID=UPI0025AD4602|nr:MLP-like protein 31 [Arachis stenosperma]